MTVSQAPRLSRQTSIMQEADMAGENGHVRAQVDRYKALLVKQRDIMIALTGRLNERDEQLLRLQEELEAYDSHQKCAPPCLSHFLEPLPLSAVGNLCTYCVAVKAKHHKVEICFESRVNLFPSI